jgi:hypothetical protein
VPSQVARHLRSALHLLRGAYPVAASATATTPAPTAGAPTAAAAQAAALE